MEYLIQLELEFECTQTRRIKNWKNQNNWTAEQGRIVYWVEATNQQQQQQPTRRKKLFFFAMLFRSLVGLITNQSMKSHMHNTHSLWFYFYELLDCSWILRFWALLCSIPSAAAAAAQFNDNRRIGVVFGNDIRIIYEISFLL